MHTPPKDSKLSYHSLRYLDIRTALPNLTCSTQDHDAYVANGSVDHKSAYSINAVMFQLSTMYLY